MTLVAPALGLLLIFVTIFDIFETLFDPEDQGPITNVIGAGIWRVFKRLSPSLLGYAGPIAYISALASWAILIHVGWALIYWQHLPDSFVYNDGIGPDAQTGFITAMYISLTTTSTLGYGDITPTVSWLRLLGPAQSLIGFLLLSAAITWILAIYQDIEIRRSLAHETTLLHDAINANNIRLRDLEPQAIERLVDEVTSRIVRVTGSLNQFPITYFFRISDDRQSLAVMSLFLLEISEELRHETLPPEVRLRASMLAGALSHLAQALSERFVEVGPDATTRDVLHAYARDHQRDITQHGERVAAD